MSEQSISLSKALKTSASSPDFIPMLDSYMYDNNQTIKTPNRTKFYIQTVDSNGTPYTYNINDFYITGVILTINPNSVNVNAAKIINRTQTMSGWLEEHWGEELDSITFQGSSAAFIWKGPTKGGQTAEDIRGEFNNFVEAKDLGTVYNGIEGTGLATWNRKDTASYDEFRQLMQLMNSNAATFDIYGLVKDRLYIQITYDYASYLGYFESFDLTENSETPFKFIYTITFKSERTLYTYRSPIVQQIPLIPVPVLTRTPPEEISSNNSETITPLMLPKTKAEFVATIYQKAKIDENKTGVPAEITVAQAILESGYGQSIPQNKDTGQVSFNLFGIKGKGPAGSVNTLTTENYNDKIIAPFAAYNNFDESIAGHSNFLKKNSRYAPLFSSKDPVAWAHGLENAGYATDKDKDGNKVYAKKLIAVMKSWKLI